MPVLIFPSWLKVPHSEGVTGFQHKPPGCPGVWRIWATPPQEQAFHIRPGIVAAKSSLPTASAMFLGQVLPWEQQSPVTTCKVPHHRPGTW